MNKQIFDQIVQGTWKHLWDENYTIVNFEAVQGYIFDAPEGFPLVFYRADSKFATDFTE